MGLVLLLLLLDVAVLADWFFVPLSLAADLLLSMAGEEEKERRERLNRAHDFQTAGRTAIMMDEMVPPMR
jgi:hypothetical protein